MIDGDVEQARDLLHEGAEAFAIIRNPLYVAWSHEGLAALAVVDGDLATARTQLAAADRIRNELPSRILPIDVELLERTRAAAEFDGEK
ncbi:hypothetical protein AADG42_04140 [Ammonicoccus fulvus]|uniref:Uncharacterized protein n=1 Tax=Ammonicoccus fulvus TaxID=3138240 RepID=A0ABZ3FN46_9ACTN